MNKEEIVKLAYQNINPIKAYIYSLCCDWVSVDDIMQNTLVSLMNSADKFDSSRNFLSWALTIARRRTIDFQRKQNKEKLLFTDEIYEQLEAEYLVIEDNSQSLKIQVLQKCLKELSPENQTILHMKYFQKMKVDDICKKLDRSFLSVQSLLDRLRKRLKQCFNEKMKEA